ncbi:MAG: hypothetical protein IJ518_03980 [Clostridia bacterium]|nr:hypothetical protein [Clostridia bacterium]
MRICSKCGAYNADERRFCVDCSEILPDPLSASEQEAVESQISESMETLYARTDPLAVTRFDKIFGWICLGGLAALLVLAVIDLVTEYRCDSPESYLCSALFLVVGAVEAFVPKITWTLEKIRLSWHISNAEEAEPSEAYRIFRRVGIVLFAGIGVAFMLMVGYSLFFAQPSGAAPDGVVLGPDGTALSYWTMG